MQTMTTDYLKYGRTCKIQHIFNVHILKKFSRRPFSIVMISVKAGVAKMTKE